MGHEIKYHGIYTLKTWAAAWWEHAEGLPPMVNTEQVVRLFGEAVAPTPNGFDAKRR